VFDLCGAAQDVPLDLDTQMRLAGCEYDEWVKVYDEHQTRLNQGRRHRETDHGQGYLEGRWGPDDIMGWGNYKRLTPAQLAGPEILAKEPPYRLNRHLLHAAETGDVKLMKLLLQAGADVNCSNNESFLPASVRFGLTHPHSHEPMTANVSVTYGSVDVARGEAQVAVYRWTALHWAANAGHQLAVSFLVAPRESGGGGGGMLLDAADHECRTALHWAAGAGHATVVGALLEAGARPNLNDTCCNTPLHFAVWGGHLEVMKSLLQADGGLAGQANSGGFTPLHWAARQGHLEAVKLLLQHGANPRSHTDDEDFTPLNLAEENVLTSLHPYCSGPHLRLLRLPIAGGVFFVSSRCVSMPWSHPSWFDASHASWFGTTCAPSLNPADSHSLRA
jgi:ankyrin repeat protein